MQWPFSKEHLGVSLSINICPPDASDKLSPKGEEVGKGRKSFCPHLPSRIKNATGFKKKKKKKKVFIYLFFQSKQAMFPSPFPLPDSPEAARREAIDYLAHKMDFVMFGVNVQHWKRLWLERYMFTSWMWSIKYVALMVSTQQPPLHSSWSQSQHFRHNSRGTRISVLESCSWDKL